MMERTQTYRNQEMVDERKSAFEVTTFVPAVNGKGITASGVSATNGTSATDRATSDGAREQQRLQAAAAEHDGALTEDDAAEGDDLTEDGHEGQDADGGRRSSLSVLELAPFFGSGKITEVLHVVKSGKEATVYCCRAHPSTGRALVAAKVYRDREHRTFKNDAVYWNGSKVGKRREQLAFQRKTGFGREVQASAWKGREYETLSVLHAAGADVPAPITSSQGAILMDYLGDEREAARQLQHVSLAPAEVDVLFDRVLRNVALWLAHHRVHADLSAFNILYWQGDITVIDFPQAVDPRSNQNAWDLLQRDLANVCRYFSRYGLEADSAWLTADLR